MKKYNLESLAEAAETKADVFICSTSFEERCLSIPTHLDPEQFKKVLVCEYEDYSKIEEKYTQEINDHFVGKAEKVVLSTRNPILTADNLSDALDSLSTIEGWSAVIDITTFSHEALLILLGLLQQRKKWNKILFAYSEAEEYAVGLEGKEKWLSKGVDDIRSILGFPGKVLPSKKIHLVVLVGFGSERAEKLIEAYEPSILSLGLSERTESIREDHHDVNAAFYKRVRKFAENMMAQDSAIRKFSFSCKDPLKTQIAVEKEISLLSEYNTVIAPMNNKISTIGVALAAIRNEAIQLCYAHPSYYNIEGYSSPSNECILIDSSIIGDNY